jgi:transposase
MHGVDIQNLPDNVEALKKIIINSQKTIETYQNEINYYKAKYEILIARFFRRSSEKITQEDLLQGRLFNEAEDGAFSKDADKNEIVEKTQVRTHTRKRGGRKPLPEYLPRIDIVHDIPGNEKKCGCGAELERIGENISEKLDIIPPQIQVLRHIRPKYACKACEGVEAEGEKTVKIAPMPPQMIPQAMVSSGTLAYIVTSKFCDALPLYRQARIMTRYGMEFSRADLSNWMMRTAEKMDGLFECMADEIKSAEFMGIDETTVRVLGEDGRKNTTDSYMWIIRSIKDGKTSLLFDYSPSRSAVVIEKYLERYEGVIQTDGYKSYNMLDKRPGIIHAGCWSHARREFFDVTKTSKSPPETNTALSYIQQLYAVENEAREKYLDPENIEKLRQEKSKPVLDRFKSWLEDKVHHVPPKSYLGGAIAYTLSQWPRLLVYLDDGRVPIDNNLVENAIRPFVIGRKNWLFAGSPRGARASARLYSIIETAKANGLDTYWYLRFLFDKLPQATSQEEIRALLPQYVTAEMITK